jgi:hypothetical protein
MEKSILTILTLDGVRVDNLPCFGIWGVLRHNPGEKQPHVLVEGARSRVSSSIFLLTICLVTRYSKMQKRHSIGWIKCNLGFFVEVKLGDGE